MRDLSPPTFINMDKPFNLCQLQYYLIPEVGVIFTFCFICVSTQCLAPCSPDRELLLDEPKLCDRPCYLKQEQRRGQGEISSDHEH